MNSLKRKRETQKELAVLNKSGERQEKRKCVGGGVEKRFVIKRKKRDKK